MSYKQASRRKHHYIYRIIRGDGAYYIGMHSTDDLEDGYFGSGRILWYSIKKHGKEAHKKQVEELLPTRESLRLREAELVTKELLKDPQCMNLAVGGNANATNEQRAKWGLKAQKKPKLTEEQRAKMREERSARRHTEETRALMSAKGKGVKKTPDHLAKIAASRLAKMSDETRMKLGSGNRGKPMSEEQKAKLSAKLKGKQQGPKPKWTEERRTKRSAQMKEYWAAKKLSS